MRLHFWSGEPLLSERTGLDIEMDLNLRRDHLGQINNDLMVRVHGRPRKFIVRLNISERGGFGNKFGVFRMHEDGPPGFQVARPQWAFIAYITHPVTYS